MKKIIIMSILCGSSSLFASQASQEETPAAPAATPATVNTQALTSNLNLAIAARPPSAAPNDALMTRITTLNNNYSASLQKVNARIQQEATTLKAQQDTERTNFNTKSQKALSDLKAKNVTADELARFQKHMGREYDQLVIKHQTQWQIRAASNHAEFGNLADKHAAALINAK